MEITTGVHDILMNWDGRSHITPFSRDKVVDIPNHIGLDGLISKAIGTEPQLVNAQLYQVGGTSWVYLIQGEKIPDMALQVARGESRKGDFEADFNNMQTLNGLLPDLFAKPFVLGSADYLHNVLSVSLTEFLSGYEELNYWSECGGIKDTFHINVPGGRHFNLPESVSLMQEAISILAKVYSKSFRNGRGLMVTGINIDEGPFVYNAEAEPRIKMVAAPILTQAKPHEFLFYLFSPHGAMIVPNMYPLFYGLYIEHDPDRTGTVYNGLYEGIKPHTTDPGYVISNWMSRFKADVTADVSCILRGINHGEITQSNEIPAAYRNLAIIHNFIEEYSDTRCQISMPDSFDALKDPAKQSTFTDSLVPMVLRKALQLRNFY